MYTSYIGRRILDLHNARSGGAPLSPRTFFDEVFFPLFFDDEQYLMWVNNSKFDQAYKQRKKKPLTPEVRREALTAFHADAAVLDAPHGHLVLGGSAVEPDAATSGQVSDVAIPVSGDDAYLSWIGAAAGVGIAGGFSLLIDHDAVLLALLEGWKSYRLYVRERPMLRSQQMETWNGWWLIHRFHSRYRPDDPLRNFNPKSKSDAGDGVRLETAPWTEVLFALARQCPEEPTTAYVYTFGNTNKTIGFVQLRLPEVQRFTELWERLFGRQEGVAPEALAEMYEPEFGFVTACTQGVIGLRAIEPAKLREYMPGGRGGDRLPKEPKNDDARITHSIYLTWIVAMLNNEELLRFAEEVARTFSAYAATGSGARATTRPGREIQNVLSSRNKQQFVERIATLVAADAEQKGQYDRLVNEVIKTPDTSFPLLLALIKFKYAVARA